MTNIESLAAKVAKLRATVEKSVSPLAAAEAELSAAREAEQVRQEDRSKAYDSRVFGNRHQDAQEASETAREPRERFERLVAEQPWFQAWADMRAARYRAWDISVEAQNAAVNAGEDYMAVANVTVGNADLIGDLTRVADERAREIASGEAEQRRTERDAFITGTD
ncbi:hypothetical protein PUR57_35455 [Streptomyces sp. JV176]|uniref:hypothetical protein n=1 Tax=Streptomyces sp. JV176 TaxID=858630 RepID=UPI002E7A19F6|nr:hypothetical protein [Streptomyces sp. JV176]MEE1803909.1 hypothetical protein [Streptomyces sp. JV176]